MCTKHTWKPCLPGASPEHGAAAYGGVGRTTSFRMPSTALALDTCSTPSGSQTLLTRPKRPHWPRSTAGLGKLEGVQGLPDTPPANQAEKRVHRQRQTLPGLNISGGYKQCMLPPRYNSWQGMTSGTERTGVLSQDTSRSQSAKIVRDSSPQVMQPPGSYIHVKCTAVAACTTPGFRFWQLERLAWTACPECQQYYDLLARWAAESGRACKLSRADLLESVRRILRSSGCP